MSESFEEWRDKQIKKHGPSFGGPYEGWHARDAEVVALEARLGEARKLVEKWGDRPNEAIDDLSDILGRGQKE